VQKKNVKIKKKKKVQLVNQYYLTKTARVYRAKKKQRGKKKKRGYEKEKSSASAKKQKRSHTTGNMPKGGVQKTEGKEKKAKRFQGKTKKNKKTPINIQNKQPKGKRHGILDKKILKKKRGENPKKKPAAGLGRGERGKV